MLNKILSFFLLCTFVLYAVEGDVSISVVEKKNYFISEEIIIKVNLMSTAYSIKSAKIELENSNDYIVLEPKSAAFLETIDINRTDWQVVHYEYRLYPLHAGKITIPSFNIRFQASMGYGQPAKDFSFQSDILTLDISAPKDVDKNNFVLSTPKYTLQSSISVKMNEVNRTKITVGDAVTLKIVQVAKNVPDILLRPVSFKKSSHYKIYEEEPLLVTKKEDRYTEASREDTYTFVAIKEGNMSIPSQLFMWWSSTEEMLHKELIESYRFHVLPNPLLLKKEEQLHKDKNTNIAWFYTLGFVLLLFVILYKLSPLYKVWREKKKQEYVESEAGCFELLLNSTDTQKLYINFYAWLKKIDPSLARSGFKGIIDMQPSFKNSLTTLEELLVDNTVSFDKILFINEVKIFRNNLLKSEEARYQGLPKNINPINF